MCLERIKREREREREREGWTYTVYKTLYLHISLVERDSTSFTGLGREEEGNS